MELDFYPLLGGPILSVDLHEDQYQAGAQGRVYRASVGSDSGLCVKALPGLTPGSAAPEVMALAQLRRHVEQSATTSGFPQPVKRSLQTILSRLPTHTTFAFFGEGGMHFLILRRFVEGRSLQQLTVPNRPIPPLEHRYILARKLAGNLTSLQMQGCVHLDPYPDNVLIQGEGLGSEIAMIDLEGVGTLERGSDGSINWKHDSFATIPTSYGKPGVWTLPPWYPQPVSATMPRPRPIQESYLAASTWQMLSILTFVLTWGFKPLTWLEPRAFQIIARAACDRLAAIEPIRLASRQHNTRRMDDFAARLGGNRALLEQFTAWFENALVNPRASPRAKDIQDFMAMWCRQ